MNDWIVEWTDMRVDRMEKKTATYRSGKEALKEAMRLVSDKITDKAVIVGRNGRLTATVDRRG
jgi:hypothetical protein